MIVKSRLPKVIGNVGSSWHDGLDENISEDLRVSFAEMGDDPIAGNEESSWILNKQGTVALLKTVDCDFRNRFPGLAGSTLKHKVSLRGGHGNMTAYHQFPLLLLPERVLDKVRRISRSMPHIDAVETEDLPNDNDPSAMYLVADGEGTEWFENTFLLPRPRNRGTAYEIGYVVTQSLLADIQRLGTAPRQYPSNTLLLANTVTVHRAPTIDLNDSERWLFRDYIYPIEAVDPR